MIVWEIFSGAKEPYWEIQDTEKIPAFVGNGGRLTQPKICPVGVWDVTVRCWSEKTKERPSFETLESSFCNLVNPNTEISPAFNPKYIQSGKK